MDMNLYVLEIAARQHLGELREAAQRDAIVASLRPPRRRLRITLGTSLIMLGRLMLGPARAF
jgi:hypothetical protein